MIAKYLEELLKQKEQLANNLRIKGVEADSSETLNTLIPKILQIQGGNPKRQPVFVAEEEQQLDTTVNLTFGFSHEAVIRNLYFRLGFLGYFSNEPEMSFVTTPFLSPTLGIAYRDIEIGNVLAELSADYYLGHLFYDGMNFAMDFSLNFSLILADYDKADIGVNFGVRDAIFAMEEGLQNQLKLIISIGVINND